MTVHPDYAYWHNALQGTLGPIHDGHPQCGFYRRRLHREGPFVPVAIWRAAEGNIVALVGDKPADAVDIWTWVCDKPITEDQYRRVRAGGAWDDEPPAPASQKMANMPSDPFEALTIEWASEKEIGDEILAKPITTQQQANQAAVFSKRIAQIAKKATDHHKVDKQPHLDAGRAVDEKWRGLKDEPADLSRRIKRHMDDFLREEARKERERQEAARREEERLRREAEDAAAAALQSGTPDAAAEAERLEQEAAAKAKEAEARNASAGRTGARVSLRTFVSARVVDYEKALLALKDHPEMKALVETLANRAIRAGVPLDGVERHEEQKAA
jgi:hypothetical protein